MVETKKPGRPKGALNKATRAVKEAALEFSDKALSTLAEIMQSPEHPAAARVSAANAILDRAHGKPAQALEVDANVRGALVQRIEMVGVRPRDDR